MFRLPLLVLLASTACAQQTFVERMNARFEDQHPRVGEPLPDATGLTADGAPFSLAETRGKWTVLVTGCLT